MSQTRLAVILVLLFTASSFVAPDLGYAQIRPEKNPPPAPPKNSPKNPARPSNKRKETPAPNVRRPQPPITRTAPPPSLRTFEFETVTVDSRGSITNRRREQAQYFTEYINGVSLEMVAVPGGAFDMGSPKSEANSDDDERPQHRVSVKTFYMGKYEVTQAQWRAVARLPKVKMDLQPDPSTFKGDNLPVEQVSWEEAIEFCERLSRATGREYRLPSEAEWEYACRAGETTAFAFGETITPKIVNYNGKYPYGAASEGVFREGTIPVGSLGVANKFGLFDMHGNVWEWCQDNWHENYNGAPSDGRVWFGGDASGRVLRGGSWLSNGQNCRAAVRLSVAPGVRFNNFGFRVVAVARTR